MPKFQYVDTLGVERVIVAKTRELADAEIYRIEQAIAAAKASAPTPMRYD